VGRSYRRQGSGLGWPGEPPPGRDGRAGTAGAVRTGGLGWPGTGRDSSGNRGSRGVQV